MDLTFRSRGRLTLGVEVEVQLVDPTTRDLSPSAEGVLAALGGPSHAIKPEIFQSMLELCTGVCRDAHEVTRDLADARQRLLVATDRLGLAVVGAGTHPFARVEDRLVSNSRRYHELIDRNQWIARRLAIFGLHVHVGVPDGDTAIHLANGLLPELGTCLGLSASSPFIYGQDTGLASARTTVFESQPTAGTPAIFGTWSEFTVFCERLHRCRAIKSLKDLWWDLRVNPAFGTVEVRVCDGGARLGDNVDVVALIHALSAHLLERIEGGERPPPPPTWRLRENKWRAARWGLEADLVIDDEGTNQSLRRHVDGLLESLRPWCERLAYEDFFGRITRTLQEGNGSDRQRARFAEEPSFASAIDALAVEWRAEALV